MSDQTLSPCNQDLMELDAQRGLQHIINNYCKPVLSPDEYRLLLTAYKNHYSKPNRSMLHSLGSNQNRPLRSDSQRLKEESVAQAEKLFRMLNGAKKVTSSHQKEESLACAIKRHYRLNGVNKATSSHQNVLVEESVFCVICLDECQGSEKEVILNCGHQYHAGCLNEWLKKKTICPICRKAC